MEPLLGTAMAYKNTLYMADNNVGMEKKEKRKERKKKTVITIFLVPESNPDT